MPPVPTVRPDGAKVRALRDERGWTTSQLARKVRRSRQLVWNVESGKPTGELTMRKFARAFGVHLREITMPGDGEQEPGEPGEVAA